MVNLGFEDKRITNKKKIAFFHEKCHDYLYFVFASLLYNTIHIIK